MNDIKIISDACQRSQTPTVVGHRSNNRVSFLVVAQGKLLGLDNKQTSGAPPHSKTRARNVELTATFWTAAAFCRFSPAKSKT
jgi:hypothetical protein